MNYKIKINFPLILMLPCLLLSVSILSAQKKNEEATKTSITSGKNTGSQMPDIWDVIHNRRSVRKFKSDEVPESDILKIIDAARMAPTSGNQQPWKFLVIRDRAIITGLMEACVKQSLTRYDANPGTNETRAKFEERIRASLSTGYFSAPVFIVVLTDNNSTYPDYNHWDGPLAAGYLMLAARALGYGTVFITDAIPENITKEVLQIPDNYTRVCITPLGVPFEWPATPPKKELNGMISFDKL
jgi:nitroreductase